MLVCDSIASILCLKHNTVCVAFQHVHRGLHHLQCGHQCGRAGSWSHASPLTTTTSNTGPQCSLAVASLPSSWCTKTGACGCRCNLLWRKRYRLHTQSTTAILLSTVTRLVWWTHHKTNCCSALPFLNSSCTCSFSKMTMFTWSLRTHAALRTFVWVMRRRRYDVNRLDHHISFSVGLLLCTFSLVMCALLLLEIDHERIHNRWWLISGMFLELTPYLR